MTKYPGRAAARSQHVSEPVRDALQAVFAVNDREVTLHDWKRIAVDREVPIKLKTFLLRRQISRT